MRWLLSGIAVCDVCDSRLGVLLNRGKYRAYVCKTGGHVARSQPKLDEYVTGYILGMLDELLLDVGAAQPDNAAAREALLEAATMQARLETFYVQAAEGALTATALAVIEAKLIPQIDAARGRAALVHRHQVLDTFTQGQVEQVWHDLALEQQRLLLRELVTVRVLTVGKGKRTFNPEAVHVSPR